MELLLIRHGKAEDYAPDGGDFGRRLTEKGWKQSELVGQLLGRQQLVPDLVLSSPLTRARETASGVMKAAELSGEPVLQEWLGFGMHGEEVLKELAALKDSVARVALVGHEPSFSGFVEWILGVERGMVEVKKASLIWISAYPPSRQGAILRMLVPPKVLFA